MKDQDHDEVCRQADGQLRETYGCGAPATFRVPRKFRDLRLSLDEIFADKTDRLDVIQISSPTRGENGGRLIVTYRRTKPDTWRAARVILGAYG